VLQHVALEVRGSDADACVRFWGLLGFREVPVPETLQGRSRWVERRGTQVHLLLAEEPVIPPAGHVAVVCRGVDGDALAPRRLRAHPRAAGRALGRPAGVRAVPGRHRVELWRRQTLTQGAAYAARGRQRDGHETRGAPIAA
jgi:hypothetical protein